MGVAQPMPEPGRHDLLKGNAATTAALHSQDQSLPSAVRCGNLPAVDNRYYYMDPDGRVHGPVWLTMMRDLYRKGRLMMSTEVSLTGSDGWQRMEFHPEIFEEEMRLPALERMVRAKSDPVRLLVWTGVLLLACAAYVAIHWNDGKRAGTPSPPRATSP